MSADLLDIDSDDNGIDICLTLYASGKGVLTLADDNNAKDYIFKPTKTDIAKAREVAIALNNWADHIEESELQDES